MSASRSVILFGTEEPVEAPPIVKAGPLEAVLEAGNLRYVTIGGREALRAIAFLVRDRNWGTYNPEISNLQIDQQADRFTVSYDAVCSDSDQSFRYSARIEGRPDGSLLFAAEGEALSDFVTNRTGFVVLHALDGVVGAPVTVEHTDGRIVESRFPELVDPVCPFQDIRALSHEISPGVRVSCRMEGDAFEMEDHRNWMDASYKTYVRPLAMPWPYTIEKGEKTPQKVELTIEGHAGGDAEVETGSVSVMVGAKTGRSMPRIGLAVPAEHAADALAKADLIKKAGPSFLVCHFDARKGHGADHMRRYRELGEMTGADLVLEAVIPCLDGDGKPSADLDIMRRDMAVVGDAAREAGVSFSKVAVSPSCDLKCTLPGSVFPDAPGWADLMQAARETFPGAEIGGGMFSYFTELNRKRPPAEVLDFICHTGCPIVHAGDDVSVTETLESLPSIFKSVGAFGGGKPYWVFPTAVSMRDNPYGAVPAENPDNIRQAMNRVDPRDRGLLGTAWYAGYLAHAARAGVDAVTLATAAGPSGIVYTGQDHAQPWFDEAGVPVLAKYHVLAGHGALDGNVHDTSSSDGRSVQALAVSGDEGLSVWLCNLTGEPQKISLSGVPESGMARVLDASTFEAACADSGWRDKEPDMPVSASGIDLDAYAVAEIRFR
jgi:hypothetical protein